MENRNQSRTEFAVRRITKNISGTVTIILAALLFSSCGLSDALLESPTSTAVNITRFPEKFTSASKVSLEVSCTGSDCDFYCHLSAGVDKELPKAPKFLPCPTDFIYEELADGYYVFQVYALNKDAQRSNTDEASWTIDTISPSLNILSRPATLTRSSSSAVTFECVDVNSCQAKCTMDDGKEENCFSPVQLATPEGEHRLSITVFDAAGNRGVETSTTIRWLSDQTKPQITSLEVDFGELDTQMGVTPDAYEDLSNSPRATFTFVSSEPDSRFECRLDRQTAMPCESGNQILTADDSTGDGSLAPFSFPHDFFVRPIDKAGNIGEWAHHSWTVDLRAPVVTLTNTPDLVSSDLTPTFSFTCDETTCDYECNLDDESPEEQWNWKPCTWPLQIPGQQGNVEWLPGESAISIGVHKFRVRAKDLAGNQSLDYAEHEWTTLGEWKQVTNSGHSICAIDTNDRLWCWGRNHGQASNSRNKIYNSIEKVHENSRWRSISGRSESVCGTKFDGSYWCWGQNRRTYYSYSFLGLQSTTGLLDEPMLGVGSDWQEFQPGYVHSCALKTDGSLWVVGNAYNGRLGIVPADNATGISTPEIIAPATNQSWAKVNCLQHSCALQTNGRLACWGPNTYGQIGNDSTTVVAIPTTITIPNTANISNWKDFSIGSNHTCAIDYLDQLWCWGSNHRGQLGHSNSSTSIIPTLVATINNQWRTISAGVEHSCGIKTDGSLWCWGSNREGQLGLNSQSDREAPSRVGSDNDWKSVHLGGDFSETSCAMKEDASLYCWGSNRFGQHGDNRGDQNIPTKVGDGYREIHVGGFHTCGITTSNGVNCWGSNSDGQLGNTSIESGSSLYPRTSTPTPISDGNLNDWLTLSLGQYHTVGLRGSNSELYAWGDNQFGQLGMGENNGFFIDDDETVPTRVPTNVSVRWDEISSGALHTCARGNQEQLWCWGQTSNGQVGSGFAYTPIPGSNSSYSFTSVHQSIPGNWSKISTGSHTSCAVTDDQEAYCWGTNWGGQLGIGSTSNTPILSPLALATTEEWKSIYAGYAYGCGLNVNNQVLCWGVNNYGQFGNGNNNANSSVPVSGGALHMDWSELSIARTSGPGKTCGLRGVGNQKTLWCWGSNEFGQLGTGQANSAQEFTPVQVTTVKTGNQESSFSAGWRQISVGHTHSCAVQDDDSLWCWGANTYGQLGHTNDYSQQLRTKPFRVLRP